MRSFLRTASYLLLLTLAWIPSRAFAAVTGNIEGTVTDQETKKKLPGVTVTVTSPALQGEQSEFTDGSGHYIITELPPGEYMVRFYFSNINVERPGVVVQADKTLSVNVAIPTQKAEVKTYRITEKAPTVDTGNTQVQTQVTSELVKNTPVQGRTYAAVLGMAPGAAQDSQGFEFNGATGLENSFLIDGVNTTSPSFGRIGTQLTLEFIGETEIITGGYNAEYGRATGGVVNVITKSGSNQFHGDVWVSALPFQLFGPVTGRAFEAIQATQRNKYGFDVGFDLGGPILKDKIWFYVGFTPSFNAYEARRSIYQRQAVDNSGPTVNGAYLGDLDSKAGCPSYLDPKLCNTPGLISQGYAMQKLDGYDKLLASQTILYNWIAKLNFQLNPNNSLVLQYIGSPISTDGYGNTNGTPLLQRATSNAPFNLDTDIMGARAFLNTHDASIHYVSKLADRRLQIDVIGGYHYSHQDITPTGPTDQGNVTDLSQRPLTNFENIPPCMPIMLPSGSTFNPCPVQNYMYGSFGGVSFQTEQRITAMAAGTYFARLGGTHALKVGFDFEENIYKDPRRWVAGDAGGRFQIRSDGSINRTQYATKDEASMMGMLLPDGIDPTTKTFNYAVYLRDSYNVSFVRGLTLNAGVRWEAQQVQAADGKTIPIAIYDNWAPRVGAIYDFTGQGRSKIYVSYGWFFESIPLDLNDRQFSGEGLASQTADPGSCKRDPSKGRIDTRDCTFDKVMYGDINGGTYSAVAPGIKGQYSEEVVAGVQYDVGLDLVLGASYIHRGLGRIIEDTSPDGGNTYIIGNPGEVDPNVVKDLQKKITAESNPMTKGELQKQLALYQGMSSFDKPKRDYNAMVLTATKRLSHNFLALASYTYSRTIGNYPGLYSPSNDQIDPNISSQYDLRDLLLNRDGPLPTDRPHNVKVSGSYFIPFGGNTVTLGLAFNGASGIPIEVLGYHPLYHRKETFILPRGSGGRTPFITSFDFHVAYRRQLSKVLGFEASADVFNLFNQQGITGVDHEYTTSTVSPIQNGTIEDLQNLLTTSGTKPVINPNYGRPTSYQSPLSMRVGARLSF